MNKYGWCDTGSSFLPSEIIAAFLWAQLEQLDTIQDRRKALWSHYFEMLSPIANGHFRLPDIPDYATNNAHMFYIVCNSIKERTSLIKNLKENGIQAVFHYLSLHSSPYYEDKYGGKELLNCDMYADCLVRLPMHLDISDEIINYISQAINLCF